MAEGGWRLRDGGGGLQAAPMSERIPRPGVVVALSGHGDEPVSAERWARRVAPPGWDVVVPEAPTDPDGTRSWFPTGPRGADPVSLERSVGQVAERVLRLQADGRPVAVVGFSQGGALAMCVGLLGCRPDAVVSICGFLPDVDDDSFVERLDRGPDAPPLLVLAGSDDEVTPAFLSEDAAAILGGGGRRVTVSVEPGGHEVSDVAAQRTRSFITDECDRGVKVTLGLPVERTSTGAELVSGDAIVELAAGYERLGFDAAFVTDHPAPDDRWLAGGGHQAMEPTVALTAAAVATRRLLVHTNVYVLPYRNPFLAAKALASLDVVSGGRLIVGVAAGYLEPEFRALGAGFEDRTDRLEDALEALPRIWSESKLALSGPGYESRSVTAEPRPLQRPHPPIWVGGNSPAALRRAVDRAQGWSPFPTPGGMESYVRTSAIADLDGLARALERARERCESVGRTEPLTICFTPFALPRYLADPVAGLSELVDEVATLAAMGVDWVSLQVPGLGRSEVLDRAAALAAALGKG